MVISRVVHQQKSCLWQEVSHTDQQEEVEFVSLDFKAECHTPFTCSVTPTLNLLKVGLDKPNRCIFIGESSIYNV